MATRLFESRLERKRKDVVFADTFRLIPKDMTRDAIKADLKDIRNRIEQGWELEPHRYRKGIDQDDDGMLTRTGIMHLHLGKPPGDDLLYLVQYDNKVIFLEVSGHEVFSDHPPGRLLADRHRAWLSEWERKDGGRVQSINDMLRKALLK